MDSVQTSATPPKMGKGLMLAVIFAILCLVAFAAVLFMQTRGNQTSTTDDSTTPDSYPASYAEIELLDKGSENLNINTSDQQFVTGSFSSATCVDAIYSDFNEAVVESIGSRGTYDRTKLTSWTTRGSAFSLYRGKGMLITHSRAESDYDAANFGPTRPLTSGDFTASIKVGDQQGMPNAYAAMRLSTWMTNNNGSSSVNVVIHPDNKRYASFNITGVNAGYYDKDGRKLAAGQTQHIEVPRNETVTLKLVRNGSTMKGFVEYGGTQRLIGQYTDSRLADTWIVASNELSGGSTTRFTEVDDLYIKGCFKQ